MQRQGWRFGNICRASALFYRMKISFPYDKKRSARIALRRKGIVSLMRPAAGLRILRSRILFYRMKTSFPYDKKRSARIALGARADGCRSNRASARECAKAHSRAEARLLRQPSTLAPSAHPRGAFLSYGNEVSYTMKKNRQL